MTTRDRVWVFAMIILSILLSSISHTMCGHIMPESNQRAIEELQVEVLLLQLHDENEKENE